jgi:hypothetical protein
MNVSAFEERNIELSKISGSEKQINVTAHIFSVIYHRRAA